MMWGGLGLVILIGLSVWVNIPAHPQINWGLLQRDLDVRLGLDLRGGSQLVYQAKINEEEIDNPDEAIAGVRDVIERRVNAFGVSEPNIQTSRVGTDYRVIVELAGVHDPNEAIKLIGETPLLDFRKEISLDEGEAAALNVDAATGEVSQFFERTELTGKNLKRSTVEFDQVTGTPTVNLEFDGAGSELFATLTRENIGKRVAIYLDGVPISAPVVQSEITNGKAVITGGFTLDEAKQLARRLNAGALPVPVELIGQQIIGPTLGQLSIRQSITAGLIGLSLVGLWMIIYYRLPGVVASLALVLYASFFFSLVKLIPITLTLAGIAGFILSIGMAVDANILIFERFRENLRAGKTVNFALRDGFNEAWSSIWAANITSLISGAVLYYFGTSIVRGFALTFALGTVLSMFTAVTISRGILNALMSVQYFQKPIFLGGPIKDTNQKV